MSSSIVISLVLGLRHALDADHLSAIVALVTSSETTYGPVPTATRASPMPRLARALATAATWGIGHTLAIMLVGIPVIGFRSTLPPAFEPMSAFAVATMLIVLGARSVLTNRATSSRRSQHTSWKSFVVGCTHGLGGSAALTLLALASLPTRFDALASLVLFGVGTIGGMVGLTAVIAWSMHWLSHRRPSALVHLARFAGAASAVTGAWIMLQLFMSR
ncbi:MAG: HupE/UreJ family protein [Myxococcales bacterium]|nr:HupE/UreJ family protein [Myxococcales bacterium]